MNVTAKSSEFLTQNYCQKRDPTDDDDGHLIVRTTVEWQQDEKSIFFFHQSLMVSSRSLPDTAGMGCQ